MRFLFLFVFLFSNLSINAVASTNLRLVCNFENYSNIGYSEDWGKSWIPEQQNYNIVADKIYAIGNGSGNITKDNSERIEFKIEKTAKRKDDGYVLGVYFRTTNLIMTRIKFNSGFKDSGYIKGKCTEEELEFGRDLVNKSDIEFAGSYDYSIICEDKNWKREANNKYFCGKEFNLNSYFSTSGKFEGHYVAKDQQGKSFDGKYKLNTSKKITDENKIDLFWVDQWGQGKLTIETSDRWKSFNGTFYIGDKPFGKWNGTIDDNYKLDSPLYSFIKSQLFASAAGNSDAGSGLASAKNKCVELGFEAGTEKYGDCVMKLLGN
ncbi:hypothetical protein N9315_05185 [Alphaproteobacteria bacterium]|nr:hypothetical protein [Alphaproteobacteria bacterium]